jgi:hypothetical protein
MELDKLAGLPAHALLVHAAVVLVPLAAIALAALCWKAEWRKHYSLPVALLSVGAAVFAYLAKSSGEPLEDRVEDAAEAAGVRARFGDHPEQGDTAFIFALLLAIAAVGVWLVDRYGARWGLPKRSPMVVYALALVPAALALITMIVAGHSGAELVWKDLGTFQAGR